MKPSIFIVPSRLPSASDKGAASVLSKLSHAAAIPQPRLERMRDALKVHLQQVGDLGDTDERELIEKGLVANVIDDYLPPEHRIGPTPFPATKSQVDPALLA
jgi:hypothetical protein